MADPSVEIQFGPNIKDWPAMSALPENMVLKVVSEIHDPVTTTDELIPSGETSSFQMCIRDRLGSSFCVGGVAFFKDSAAGVQIGIPVDGDQLDLVRFVVDIGEHNDIAPPFGQGIVCTVVQTEESNCAIAVSYTHLDVYKRQD